MRPVMYNRRTDDPGLYEEARETVSRKSSSRKTELPREHDAMIIICGDAGFVQQPVARLALR